MYYMQINSRSLDFIFKKAITFLSNKNTSRKNGNFVRLIVVVVVDAPFLVVVVVVVVVVFSVPPVRLYGAGRRGRGMSAWAFASTPYPEVVNFGGNGDGLAKGFGRLKGGKTRGSRVEKRRGRWGRG